MLGSTRPTGTGSSEKVGQRQAGTSPASRAWEMPARTSKATLDPKQRNSLRVTIANELEPTGDQRSPGRTLSHFKFIRGGRGGRGEAEHLSGRAERVGAPHLHQARCARTRASWTCAGGAARTAGISAWAEASKRRACTCRARRAPGGGVLFHPEGNSSRLFQMARPATGKVSARGGAPEAGWRSGCTRCRSRETAGHARPATPQASGTENDPPLTMTAALGASRRVGTARLTAPSLAHSRSSRLTGCSCRFILVLRRRGERRIPSAAETELLLLRLHPQLPFFMKLGTRSHQDADVGKIATRRCGAGRV